jgi:DsbE subfamily thiol:disulfide oxidoreductase
MEALTGEKLSVGPQFFNATFVPMMLPLVLLMGAGPFLSWKRADLKGVLQRLRFVALLAVLAGLTTWYLARGGPVLAYLSVGLAAWLLLATLREWAMRIRLLDVPLKDAMRRARNLPRAAHGMTMAHAGLAVAMFGFVGSSAWKSEEIVFVQPGTVIEIAGFDVRFDGVERLPGPNYVADRGTLAVSRDGAFVTTLYPERRFYPVADSSTTESAIRSTLAGDLYASLAEPASDSAADRGAWTLRILYEPLVNFIWIGSAMLILGGALSLSDRRLRVGAAPAFDLPPVEGVGVPGLSRGDLTGNADPVVVNVFASWCVPCRAEHAVLTRMVERDGIRLFGINYKDKPEAARSWLEELGNPYELIGSDLDGRAGIEWGISGVPETFIVAGDGTVLYRYVGPIVGPEAEGKFATALAQARANTGGSI